MSKEAMKLALEALKQIDEAMPFPVAKLAQAALREALAEQPAQQEQDRQIDQLIQERDHRDKIIDKLCDAVLGPDRYEWSSQYFFEDAVREVEERIAALEKPAQQEPVAWICYGSNNKHDIDFFEDEIADLAVGTMLYTHAQRTWVGLTDEDIDQCLRVSDGSMGRLLSAIEAKLREKNR